ncbi:MAG: hypothetical protein LBH43_05000 [Treponema sp.]|jgi:hypothetical protein|nr:hypothetical protein [Treponema sp.]
MEVVQKLKFPNNSIIPAPLDFPDNSVAVLVGFAGMSIRLGFSSTYDSFTSGGDMHIESGIGIHDYYKSYEPENGNLIPQRSSGAWPKIFLNRV